MQGRGINPGLAPLGQSQAEKVAAALRDRPLTAIYSSPLLRARETAEAIAKAHQLEVATEHDLIEVDPGRWEGLSWAQIEDQEPDLYHAFREDPASHGYPDGENLTQVAERVAGCLERLMQSHLGQEIAVVAHSVVNRVYLGQLLGMTLAGGRKIPQENCSLNLVRYRDQRPKVVTINAVGHLDIQ